MIHLSALSRTYLRVLVEHRNRPVDAPALTADLVEFAFVDNPLTADWKVGGWESVGTRSYARILIGPGGSVQLTPGRRPVLLRVTDNPERPVWRAGHVMVY